MMIHVPFISSSNVWGVLSKSNNIEIRLKWGLGFSVLCRIDTRVYKVPAFSQQVVVSLKSIIISRVLKEDKQKQCQSARFQVIFGSQSSQGYQ
ncbi:hypothetical protein C5167_027362 [Papaver somniferum]|nr:hypothetical protein C5167_027362 [Papaver somniferum]